LGGLVRIEQQRHDDGALLEDYRLTANQAKASPVSLQKIPQ
jgi:hypothetical protein